MGDPSVPPLEVLAKNRNLSLLYKNLHQGVLSKKISTVGIELITDHHWFESLMLIQMCYVSRDERDHEWQMMFDYFREMAAKSKHHRKS